MRTPARMPPSMRLFTREERNAMIEQWRKTLADEGGGDPFPAVKLFLPGTGATWLLTELDPDEEICFGLCDLGLGCPELGYVSLIEITEAQIMPGVTVERDTSFKPTKTFSAYALEANQKGRIDA